MAFCPNLSGLKCATQGKTLSENVWPDKCFRSVSLWPGWPVFRTCWCPYPLKEITRSSGYSLGLEAFSRGREGRGAEMKKSVKMRLMNWTKKSSDKVNFCLIIICVYIYIHIHKNLQSSLSRRHLSTQHQFICPCKKKKALFLQGPVAANNYRRQPIILKRGLLFFFLIPMCWVRRDRAINQRACAGGSPVVPGVDTPRSILHVQAKEQKGVQPI